MTTKDDMVYDLITGKWHGAFVDEYEEDQTHGGHRPKIRRVGRFLPGRAKYFPYPLDRQQHMIQIPVVGGPDLQILKPTKQIPGLDYEATPWAKLVEDDQQTVEKLRQQLKTVRKEVGKLKKENRRLREEQEEKEKREKSQAVDKVACKYCGTKQSPQKWSSDDGRCSSCGEVMEKYRSQSSRRGRKRRGGGDR